MNFTAGADDMSKLALLTTDRAQPSTFAYVRVLYVCAYSEPFAFMGVRNRRERPSNVNDQVASRVNEVALEAD